jgi:hypothetical protein
VAKITQKIEELSQRGGVNFRIEASLGGTVDLLPDLPSFIRRACSSFAPAGGVLRTRLVLSPLRLRMPSVVFHDFADPVRDHSHSLHNDSQMNQSGHHSVQQLESLITADPHRDAMLDVGNGDHLIFSWITPSYLLAHPHLLAHLL